MLRNRHTMEINIGPVFFFSKINTFALIEIGIYVAYRKNSEI